MAGITTTNRQYTVGTVSVTNGSPTVTGAGTLWTDEVVAGNWFSIKGEGIWYDVIDVSADGKTLTLETPYLGATNTGAAYLVQRNFTAYNGYPIPAYGDQDTGTLLGYALAAIDLKLAQITPKLSGVVNGDLKVTGAVSVEGASFQFDFLSSTAAFLPLAVGSATALYPFAGLKIERGTTDAFLAWNEGSKRWGAYTSPDGATMTLTDLEAKTVYGTLASPSDAKLKIVLGPVRDALHRVGLLNGVRFLWNAEAKRRGIAIDGVDVGLIAQDVERALPEAVEGLDETRVVHYGKVVALLVEAVKDLDRRNADLTSRIAQLEGVASRSAA